MLSPDGGPVAAWSRAWRSGAKEMADAEQPVGREAARAQSRGSYSSKRRGHDSEAGRIQRRCEEVMSHPQQTRRTSDFSRFFEPP